MCTAPPAADIKGKWRCSLLLLLPFIFQLPSNAATYAALSEAEETKSPAHEPEMPATARLLEQIQIDIQRKLDAVAQVWCHQTVYRYSQTGKTSRPVDRIEADVELIDGVEAYTSVRRGPRNYRTFRETRGAWSSGEFSTILRTSGDVVRSEPGAVMGAETEANGPINGAIQDRDEIAVLSFRHLPPRAAWIIEIGPNDYPISFEGKIWISRTSGEIKRIQWLGINLPAEMGLSAVEWSVSFGTGTVAGKPDTRPLQSTYTVVYKGTKKRLDRNVTLFSNFRRYSSDAVISYGLEAPSDVGERPSTAPAGLPGQPSERNPAPLRRVF